MIIATLRFCWGLEPLPSANVLCGMSSIRVSPSAAEAHVECGGLPASQAGLPPLYSLSESAEVCGDFFVTSREDPLQ